MTFQGKGYGFRVGLARFLQRRWWGLLAGFTQDALASTLLNDAPKLLHGWPTAEPAAIHAHVGLST